MNRVRNLIKILSAACAVALSAAPAHADAILWNLGGNPNTAASLADFTQAGVLEDLTGASVFNVQGSPSGTVATDGSTGVSLTYLSGSAASGGGQSGAFSNQLLNQYHFFNGGGPANLQISGLSSNLDANTTYKLYLFGIGDSANQNATFGFGGSSVTVDGSAPPANIDQRVAEYQFATGASVSDTLDFTWARTGGNQYAGFNGFAITEVGPTGDSIALNFVDGRNGSGPDALGSGLYAGVVPQSNWNNTDANTSGDGTHGTKNTSSIAGPVADTLVDSHGVVTGVTATWTGHTTWSAPSETGTANDVMMSDYLLTEADTGPDASVTFSGLDYDTYDVYVYFGGSVGNSGFAGTMTLNGTIDIDVTSLAFSGGPLDRATGGGEAGNYVLFEDVAGSSFTVSLDATGSGYHMGLFGVQIVNASQIPTPAALPAGLVLTTLIASRCRRR